MTMAIENKYLPPIKISNEGSVAIEAALAAGKAIRKAVGGEVKIKEGMSNVVNEADIASGIAIRKVIFDTFPVHQILSEDPPEEQPEIENPLHQKNLWVIDELDGSKNFASRIDNVWVAIAYAERGVVKVGVCYNPILDRMFYAEQGKGSYYLGNEYGSDNWTKQKLQVSAQNNLSKADIETSISYSIYQTIDHELIKLGLLLKGITPRFREIGSSVEQICRVGFQTSDLQFHTDLKPWDYAAPSLILAEAGGVIRRMDGSRFNFMCPDAVCGNRELVATFIKEARSMKLIRKVIVGGKKLFDFVNGERKAA